MVLEVFLCFLLGLAQNKVHALSASVKGLDGVEHRNEHIVSLRDKSRPSSHLLNSVPTALPTSNRCPGGTMYNGRCFYLGVSSRSWTNCQTYCQNNGWRMLCVDSLATNTFIRDTYSTYSSLWLGLNDRTTENTYVWSSSCTPSTYRLWTPGQPDNWYGNEDYVEMSIPAGTWNDADGALLKGCGCESTWTAAPTNNPTNAPTIGPSTTPSIEPTRQPSHQPSMPPSPDPSVSPSMQPTVLPSVLPTLNPSSEPTLLPTLQPTAQPTIAPSSYPSKQPSLRPTEQPSFQPSLMPSARPSVMPTPQPSAQPTGQPSSSPSTGPSSQPTWQPTAQPSLQPSGQPSLQPSHLPTSEPTLQSKSKPSSQPSVQPSGQPSLQPNQPTSQPSIYPCVQPTNRPSSQPTRPVTARPSRQPNTPPPQQQLSNHPSELPTEQQPSAQPSALPSAKSSYQPTRLPTAQPSTNPSLKPSTQPLTQPTQEPTAPPSEVPSVVPSKQPSVRPSNQPTVQPSNRPSLQPSSQPTSQLSKQPSSEPTMQPSVQPSDRPTIEPTVWPTSLPSTLPTGQPTARPSEQPEEPSSHQPSSQPSVSPLRDEPSLQPTSQPSLQRTGEPSVHPTERPITQLSICPTVLPLTLPSQQPRAVPTIQPTSAPSEGPTSEWAVILNQSAPSAAALTSLNDHIWVCSATGLCEILDADTGSHLSQIRISRNVFSVLTVEDSNLIVFSGHNVSQTTLVSQVSTCEVVQNKLMCDVSSYSGMFFLATSYVPYSNHRVHLSQINKLPTATIVRAQDNTAQTYIYSAPIMGSVVLSHIQSPPNFVGSFVAGTGVRGAGDLSPCIVVGRLRTDYGGFAAMYLAPSSSTIMNSAELVNAMALEYANPDSFIVGGMELNDGAGMHAYVIRANGLFESVTYCMRYRTRAVSDQNRRASIGEIESSTSVARGVVHVEGSLYVIVDIARVRTESTGSDQSVSVVRILAKNGEVTKQVNIAARNGSIHCSEIISANLYLTILCSLEHASVAGNWSSMVISVDRALSFKKLPKELFRDDAFYVEPENVPFSRTVFSVVTSRVATDVLQSPSVAPTHKPSRQPSSAPSAQPSSSPTSAPSVSPQPTSHPSTGGPTNTYKPTAKPSQLPSRVPTEVPTIKPSCGPTVTPTAPPTVIPTAISSLKPSVGMTKRPTRAPAVRPILGTTSEAPSIAPSAAPKTTSKEVNETEDIVIVVSVAGAVLLGFFGYVTWKYKNNWTKEYSKSQRRAKFLAQEEETWGKILQKEKELLQKAESASILRRKLKNEEKNRMFALASVIESSGEASSVSDASKLSADGYVDGYSVSSPRSSEISSDAQPAKLHASSYANVSSRNKSSNESSYESSCESSFYNSDSSESQAPTSRTNSSDSGDDVESTYSNQNRLSGARGPALNQRAASSTTGSSYNISSMHSSERSSPASSPQRQRSGSISSETSSAEN